MMLSRDEPGLSHPKVFSGIHKVILPLVVPRLQSWGLDGTLGLVLLALPNWGQASFPTVSDERPLSSLLLHQSLEVRVYHECPVTGAPPEPPGPHHLPLLLYRAVASSRP